MLPYLGLPVRTRLELRKESMCCSTISNQGKYSSTPVHVYMCGMAVRDVPRGQAVMVLEAVDMTTGTAAVVMIAAEPGNSNAPPPSLSLNFTVGNDTPR